MKLIWALRALLYKIFFGKIGWMSYLGQPIFLLGTKKIFIGNRVRIFPHCRLEVHGSGKLVIEDNCSIGQNLHIVAGSELIIKKNTLLSFGVMITDVDHNYDDISTPIADQALIVKKTTIGENCFLGARVTIQAGTTLGRNCIVGANSVLKGDYPDYSVIVGTPGRIVKKYDFNQGSWIKVSESK